MLDTYSVESVKLGGKVTKVEKTIFEQKLKFKDKLTDCIVDANEDETALTECDVVAEATLIENGGDESEYKRLKEVAIEKTLKST